ncbi:hypothetical protein HCN44_004076 [Aphidius gifuensis]|uniref:Peptidase M12B domain-containing protein n=1 Tax=Aphidius gifuensis TaxID=684658 RepID=A0A835CS50_APHGI|nr:hypothetical protein HCN44_004076 [Aphidius gifuensis]
MAKLNKIYTLLLLTSLAALVQNSEVFGSYRSPVEAVYPTINCIIDYSVYESHNFNEQEIAKEFSYIWKNVQELYKKINNPKIEIIYRGCRILKSKKESNFIMASLIGYGIINPESALKTFGEYLFSQRTPVGGQANINVLFTNYKMCMGNCGRTNTVGLANVASACSDISEAVGVIKVQEPHNTVHTVAHELAHMLGAHHDGDRRTNNCNSKDFIMTPTHGIKIDSITTPNPLDEYKWSSCTVDMIRNYITMGDGQCLLKQSNKKNHDDDIYKTKVEERKPKNLFNKPTTPPPKKNNGNVQKGIGNKFSLHDALLGIDNECKNNGALGICYSQYYDNNICKPMMCEYPYKRHENMCKSIDRQYSKNTPCGDDKVCLDGSCVYKKVPIESPNFSNINNHNVDDDSIERDIGDFNIDNIYIPQFENNEGKKKETIEISDLYH